MPPAPIPPFGGTIFYVAISDVGTVTLPALGAIASWQAAFIIVGLPGLFVGLLALTITEPARQGLLRERTENPAEVPVAHVIRFLTGRWRSYGAIFTNVSILPVIGYGYLNWYPTFLMRTYGMSAGDVGIQFSLIYLVFGSAGACGGPMIAEYLQNAAIPMPMCAPPCW